MKLSEMASKLCHSVGAYLRQHCSALSPLSIFHSFLHPSTAFSWETAMPRCCWMCILMTYIDECYPGLRWTEKREFLSRHDIGALSAFCSPDVLRDSDIHDAGLNWWHRRDFVHCMDRSDRLLEWYGMWTQWLAESTVTEDFIDKVAGTAVQYTLLLSVNYNRVALSCAWRTRTQVRNFSELWNLPVWYVHVSFTSNCEAQLIRWTLRVKRQ